MSYLVGLVIFSFFEIKPILHLMVLYSTQIFTQIPFLISVLLYLSFLWLKMAESYRFTLKNELLWHSETSIYFPGTEADYDFKQFYALSVAEVCGRGSCLFAFHLHHQERIQSNISFMRYDASIFDLAASLILNSFFKPTIQDYICIYYLLL